MNVIGHQNIDGVPHINGKPAQPKPVMAGMEGALAPWSCPECGANLSAELLICLNACHLSAASYKRFLSGLGHYGLDRALNRVEDK